MWFIIEYHHIDVSCDLFCVSGFPTRARSATWTPASRVYWLCRSSSWISAPRRRCGVWVQGLRSWGTTHILTNTHTQKPGGQHETPTIIFLLPHQLFDGHCKMPQLQKCRPQTLGPRHVQEGPLSLGSWISGLCPKSKSAIFADLMSPCLHIFSSLHRITSVYLCVSMCSGCPWVPTNCHRSVK